MCLPQSRRRVGGKIITGCKGGNTEGILTICSSAELTFLAVFNFLLTGSLVTKTGASVL